jgi:hypothetical protein
MQPIDAARFQNDTTPANSSLTLYLGIFFDTLTGREPESFLSRRLPQSPAHGIERPEMQNLMQDAVMLLFTVVFFALAFLYVKACQKLR